MKWQRFRYTPCLPLGEDGRCVTGSKEHIELSREAATEGMVLLKNDDGLLPIKRRSRIALFGKASIDYVKGGGGSGDVTVKYVHNLCDGMEEKEEEKKVEIYAPLSFFYRENVEAQYKSGVRCGQAIEPEIPDKLLNGAKEFADIAIISICRYSTEGIDRGEENDFYLTGAEKKMIDTVTSNFENCVLVLNVGGMVDSSYFIDNDRIKSVLLAWQAGMEGGKAEADILCGDITPSGKLTDTFAKTFSDYPSSYNFNESEDYAEYTDDIFVGYRYFETVPNAKESVNYAFGYGLSYTEFKIDTVSANASRGKIYLTVCVTNTGEYKGKEVVQVYSSSPKGKLDKPRMELRAFSKTKILEPKEKCLLLLSFEISNMASYDEKTASYVLENGDYTVFVGNSVRNISKVFTYSVDADTVVCSLKNRCVPKKLSKRLLSDGSYKQLETGEYETLFDTSDFPHERPRWTFLHTLPDMRDSGIPDGNITLDMVYNGDSSLSDMLAQMTNEELITLLGGRPNTGVANTWGIGDMPNFGVPNVMTADGPAGLRIKPEAGICTTAWPCATLLACSWNPDLLRRVGSAGASEVKENNLGIWLTPAINIHRSPLCGRNFEYFSEDPYVAGTMASAMIEGIQSQGISACIKHFACNNKETNRFFSDSRVSERALREIYLKGFEIAIKNAKPWCVMTAYNKLNGCFASENIDLIRGILREEWHYDGLVTSDWCNEAEQYREIIAGNNVRMPMSHSRRTLKALELGLINRSDLEKNAEYILDLILKL